MRKYCALCPTESTYPRRETNLLNRNGRTTGIALPTAEGQEAVIRKAYAKTGLNPSDTTYVECHGTGTSVGDAIEGM